MSLPIRSILQTLLLGALLFLAVGCGPGGSSPELQSVADQLVAVNQELVVVLSASDADGDEVFYSFESDVPGIYDRASLNRLPVGVGEFRWTPQADDVGEWFFDFIASDGNRTDTVTIRIEVRSAIGSNSAPRFVHPQGSGTTLNLAEEACLSLNVEVTDADTAEVRLGQAEPLIEGATLQALTGLTATWDWCPSPEQIASDDRYTLLLSADDADNAMTMHPYLIVLRQPLKPDCPGEAPVITHTPQDLESLVSLSIHAEITDDIGLKQEPLLYYSSTAPSSPPDLSSMVQVTMQPESGDLTSSNWLASVPNPAVGLATGASAEVYYVIVADDDDDASGNCDHLTQAPSTGAYQITVTNPGGAGGAGICQSCTADVQCGDANDHCVLVGVGSESFCLQDCETACPDTYECSATDLSSVEGAIAPQCVPSSMDCQNPGGTQCIDDSFENNDTRVATLDSTPLPEGITHSLVSCPAVSGVGDDEDWFRVVLSTEATLSATLNGTGISDLDLGLYSESGAFLASSRTLSSMEALTECLPQGSYFLRVYAFGVQENPYTLSYTLSPGSCDTSCQADANEQDDNAAQATVIDIAAGTYEATSQSICSLDPDWYKVDLNNDEIVLVDLTFNQTVTAEDLDIHFYDSNSVDLTPCSALLPATCDTDNGQGSSSNESAVFGAPSTGCSPCSFYVVIEGFGEAANNYSIKIEGG